MKMVKQVCSLCKQTDDFINVAGPDNRPYYRCNNCMIIVADPKYFPTVAEEKERYLQHNNGIEYPGYVKFLNQAIEPVLPRLDNTMRGIDYGCGPVPTLSVLLKEKGIDCHDYDPIFFPEMPAGPFDFIFATECFEHFFNPAEEITQIGSILKSGGLLVVMTHLWDDTADFSKWYYPKDPTHVCFYHSVSFKYIAEAFHYDILPCENKRVIILRKH